MRLLVQQRENMSEQPWQLRSPASAGSWTLATSGYFSRASLIRQYTWPPEAIPGQLRQLKQLYVQAGLPVTAFSEAENRGYASPVCMFRSICHQVSVVSTGANFYLLQIEVSY